MSQPSPSPKAASDGTDSSASPLKTTGTIGKGAKPASSDSSASTVAATARPDYEIVRLIGRGAYGEVFPWRPPG